MSRAFQANALNVDPSLAINKLLICRFFTRFDDRTLIFSITKFGSRLPDPKGESKLRPKVQKQKVVDFNSGFVTNL